VVEHRQVGGHVEGEAVHRTPPGDAHTDGGDLPRGVALRIDPHAGHAFHSPAPGEPEVGEYVDDELFDRVDVGRDRAGAARYVPDDVADELSGPVVGDIAAPVGPVHRGPDSRRIVDEHVFRSGPHAERVHRWVLEEEQVVVAAAVGVEAPLKSEPVFVADAAQPTNPLSGHTSADQSRVSRMVRTRSMNAAA
jgi:hypothetical protein